MERVLLDRRQELLRQVERLEGDLDTLQRHVAVELIEEGQEQALANVLARLDEHDRAEIIAIDHALARIRRGRYRFCEGCADPIEPARQRALPTATLCRVCAEAQERTSAPLGRAVGWIGFPHSDTGHDARPNAAATDQRRIEGDTAMNWFGLGKALDHRDGVLHRRPDGIHCESCHGQHRVWRSEQFRRVQRYRHGLPRLRDRARRRPQYRHHLHLRLQSLRHSRRSPRTIPTRRIPRSSFAMQPSSTPRRAASRPTRRFRRRRRRRRTATSARTRRSISAASISASATTARRPWSDTTG